MRGRMKTKVKKYYLNVRIIKNRKMYIKSLTFYLNKIYYNV